MPRTRPTLRARLARTIALVCVGALTLTGCEFSVYKLPLPGGVDVGDHPYTVHVKFRDVLDLVPKSAVKVDDVTVGRVDSVALDGYVADVTLVLRGGVRLPDNAVADIRQTSLLGEKYVDLSAPDAVPPQGRLGDGDVIPLERSGRNPEVEEVLGALSLLLNGGGIAQIQTITTELNKALSGREGDVRSVLDQLDVFMRQLDDNKEQIVDAIRSLNKLAVSVNRQRGSIELALDEMPRALASIDRQRDDLVKMLRALSRLSDVGTRVIRQSKTATIDSLRSLAPTLTKLAEAGDALPKAFQVFLTYPFVDAVVGKNPVQARNLHMGDYTNLSVQLDLDLRHGLPQPPGLPGAPEIPLDQLQKQCKKTPLAEVCRQLDNPPKLPEVPLPTLSNPSLSSGTSSGDTGGSTDTGGGTAGGSGDGGQSCLVPPLVCRAAPAAAYAGRATGRSGGDPLPVMPNHDDYDSTLGALLVWGMVKR
ncbi:MAG TPA: MCE family protein [Nocardioidaceae bacterium]|jgi:phospholipid/cholesterol/gamma-HCH transport system substrate-binding protein